MDNLIREYVAALDRETCIQIIKDHEQLELDGFIGDSVIREQANHVRDVLPKVSGGPLVMWMDRLAFEVYRRFTYENSQIL